MNRRSFLKLVPLAGFAAAFGVKLRAEPKIKTGFDTFTVYKVNGMENDYNEDEVWCEFYSGPLGIPWDSSSSDPLQDLSLAYDEMARAGRITYV